MILLFITLTCTWYTFRISYMCIHVFHWTNCQALARLWVVGVEMYITLRTLKRERQSKDEIFANDCTKIGHLDTWCNQSLKFGQNVKNVSVYICSVSDIIHRFTVLLHTDMYLAFPIYTYRFSSGFVLIRLASKATILASEAFKGRMPRIQHSSKLQAPIHWHAIRQASYFTATAQLLYIKATIPVSNPAISGSSDREVRTCRSVSTWPQ